MMKEEESMLRTMIKILLFPVFTMPRFTDEEVRIYV